MMEKKKENNLLCKHHFSIFRPFQRNKQLIPHLRYEKWQGTFQFVLKVDRKQTRTERDFGLHERLVFPCSLTALAASHYVDEIVVCAG